MKQRLCIKRAEEEILRCNVEVRRLHTHIYDEKERYASILHRIHEASDPIYFSVEEYCTRRQHVNEYLLEKIQQIFNLPGFSGPRTVGHWIGSVIILPLIELSLLSFLSFDILLSYLLTRFHLNF